MRVLVPLLALLGACQADQFVCGELVDRTPLRCDRPQELCVCSQQRCAQPERDCESGYAYSFPQAPLLGTECVPSEETDTAFAQHARTGEDALCPSRRAIFPRCGALDESGQTAPCPQGQVCICETNRCASQVRECATGYRYAQDGQEGGGSCLEPSTISTRLEDPALLCPLDASGDCGRPGASTCLEGQVCLCDQGRCATFDRGCPQKYRLALDGRAQGGECAPVARELAEPGALCSDFDPTQTSTGAPP